MLIPHKVKNKGKYISFHYLRGWKARKIRKVQEISPQIPIYLLHFIIFYPKTLFLDCQRAAFRLPFLLTYTRSLSTQFPPHMPLYYLSIHLISSGPAFSVVPSHLVFPQSALPRFPPALWPPDRLGSDVPSALPSHQ